MVFFFGHDDGVGCGGGAGLASDNEQHLSSWGPNRATPLFLIAEEELSRSWELIAVVLLLLVGLAVVLSLFVVGIVMLEDCF